MVDDGGLGEARVRAAQLGGHERVELGHALDVGLVDDRVVVVVPRGAVVPPVEVRGDDDRAHGGAGGVLLIAHRDVVEVVGVQGLRGPHVPGDRLGVRVQQQLGGVAAQAVRRVVGAVDAVAVALAGTDRGKVGVPHVRIHLRQPDSGLGAGVVEEAQLDLVGDGGEHCEVGSRAVVGRAQRVGPPRPGGGRHEGGSGGDGPALRRRLRRPLRVTLRGGVGGVGVGGRGSRAVGCGGRSVRRHRDTLPRARHPAPQHDELMMSPARGDGAETDLARRPCSATFPSASIIGPPPVTARGCGSVGRASPCQGEGRGFESRHPLGRLAQR